MISNFSSFVEFFAAIYVTMAVNNDFCSNFWTPKYYKEMEGLLNTYDFAGSSNIHKKLRDEIKRAHPTKSVAGLTKNQRYTVEKERNVPYSPQLASESLQFGVK